MHVNKVAALTDLILMKTNNKKNFGFLEKAFDMICDFIPLLELEF